MPSLSTISTFALLAEWRNAVGRLPPNLAARLAEPQFAILPELKNWGQWRGGAVRRIELAERLILRHPWYAVVDVLRHEIAHQVVECCFPQAGESAHGPQFRAVCRLLGARPEASGDYPTLDQLVFNEDAGTPEQEGAVTPQARMLVRVRKLLALSASPNQHEAEAALLKARELAAKYELDLDSAATRPEETFYTITIGAPLPRIALQESLLGNLLHDFFNVTVVWETTPDPERRDRFCKQLALSGTPRHLRLASYVYDCIRHYMKSALYDLPAAMLGKALGSARARADFEIGVLKGFRTVLEAQNQRPEVRALVLADRTRLDEYVRWVYPHLRTSRSSRHETDPRLRQAGEEAGRKFRLHPGVEDSRAPRQIGPGGAP